VASAGAVRFTDATTGRAGRTRLRVEAPGASLVRNRSGLYVIRRWDELAAHESEFLSPPSVRRPARDPETQRDRSAGDYLSVAAQVRLPRVSDPAHAADADSLFQPAVVPLYPSASAPVGANWAVLRVSLSEAASGDALGGALLRVRSNGAVLARGLTDCAARHSYRCRRSGTTFSEDADAVVIPKSMSAAGCVRSRLGQPHSGGAGARGPSPQFRRWSIRSRSRAFSTPCRARRWRSP